MITPTSPLARLLAKSPQRGRQAETLVAHLAATLRAAELLAARTGRITAADGPLGGAFWQVVALAALCHDAGKLAGGFQCMVCGRTRSWGERHEVLSLGFLPPLIDNEEALSWVAAGVLTHHRPLRDGCTNRSIQALYHEDTVAELRERFDRCEAGDVAALLGWLHTTARSASLPVRKEPPAAPPDDALHEWTHELLTATMQRWGLLKSTPEDGLAAVLMQGAVTTADRLSSAHRTLHAHQPVAAGFRAQLERTLTDNGHALREHQLRAAETSGHLLLRAPTGSGKTEAALLWAARQAQEIAAETGGTPRLYYTLPYLASINAMTGRFASLLGDDEVVGVAHSRAASYHLATAVAPEDGEAGSAEHSDREIERAGAAARAVARAEATRMFRETVRVGTPYQLLRSALAGVNSSGVLVDSCNSVFVLDELHAYDPERLGYILAMAALWQRLGGRVAVLSATLPAVLSAAVRRTLGSDVAEVSCPDIGLPTRHRIRTRPHHLTDPEAVTEIATRLEAGESVLVVANNVAHAIDLLEQLGPVAVAAHDRDPEAALLLHSRFRRRDRGGIETRVRDRYGTRQPRRGGLLVATQVVEVSLDVDFDVLFTAAAPLEALLQRFGRVNRVAARPAADVVVHAPCWRTRRGKGDQEYADGIYEQEPVAAGWEILRAHDGRPADESEATAWLDQVYSGDWGARWQESVRDQQERFTAGFLDFSLPFEDRSQLEEGFEALFDGTEAILDADRDEYREALHSAGRAAGRLLADDLLIPLPHWAGPTAGWDKELKVRVVQGEYDERLGLTAVHTRGTETAYAPGEVL